MIDIIKSAFINITRNRARATLTIVGIAIGVLSVVIISSIGEVGKDTILSELQSLGMDGIAVSNTVGGISIDAEEEIERSGIAKTVMPLVAEYTYSTHFSQRQDCVLFGVNEGADQMVKLKLLHGRMLSKSDILSNSDVAVVDENYAKALYNRGDIVGKDITISAGGALRELSVIGVVSSGGNILGSLMGEYIPCFVYIPHSTMATFSGKTSFDQVMLKLDKGVTAQKATAKIKTIMKNNGLGAEVKIENLATQKDKLSGILSIVTTVLSIIAAISLVVAGLSIMTVMLVSVSERTFEIGIKKSIGAPRRWIMFEFLIESLMLCLIGSIVGVLLGLVLSWCGAAFLGFTVQYNANMILLSVLFACMSGIAFGVYPASKAAKLSPVEALARS
jgi:ABC-type transport system, involved in lipoprotein release, permease component